MHNNYVYRMSIDQKYSNDYIFMRRKQILENKNSAL